MELIEIRRSASRQYVREVITSDINLLSNKIESLKNDVSYKESTVTQWSEVIAGRRKIRSHTRHSESKPIPVIHSRYEVLNSCYISEYVNSDPVGSQPLVINSKIKSNMSTKVKQKILVIGDSHACGIASDIQLNLGDDFEIQGIAKPGSDLAAITHTVNRDIGALTKQDAVVVWGGIRDISRNESQKGLGQVRKFVERHSQTNILVVNVPNRCDLDAHSCVNNEVNAFNRKLGKHMKSFQNATTVKVTSDRNHFTKHGLNLNRKGKEQAAKTIANSIEEIFKLQKEPIKMSWKDKQNLEGANTVNNNIDKDDDLIIHKEQANRDEEQKDDKLPSKRARRLPTTRHDDFLWLDINTNQ